MKGMSCPPCAIHPMEFGSLLEGSYEDYCIEEDICEPETQQPYISVSLGTCANECQRQTHGQYYRRIVG